MVKIPRWDFKKFAGADPVLGPQMKAVGEVMAIGRTFPEALQKGVRSLDIGMDGFGSRVDGDLPAGSAQCADGSAPVSSCQR